MVLLPYKYIFIFSKKGSKWAIPPTTEVAGLLAHTYEIFEQKKRRER